MDFVPDLTFEMCLAAVKQTGGKNVLCVPYRFQGRVALRDEEDARRQEETTFETEACFNLMSAQDVWVRTIVNIKFIVFDRCNSLVERPKPHITEIR